MRKLFTLAIAIFAIVSVAHIDCQAQAYSGGQNARALIDQPINEARLATLTGNTHPAANAENDRGPVEDSFPLEHMQLVLQRPPELEKALEAFMDEQQRKGSPEYHHWLNAKEFADRYGVSSQDIEKVSNWLRNHGFRVDNALPSGMGIEFSGTAGQVKQAFHTEIHNLDVEGEPHFANMSDPQIPAALTGVVVGVHALHNFMPHSMMKRHSDFTMVDGTSTFYAVVPADLATIYNLNPAYSQGITGTGQTVVVIEDTLLANTSDVATFRSAFGLSGYSGTFSQITATGTATTCNGSGVNGDEGEAALDAEWAGASAPNAAVVLASCADTTTVFGGLIALQNLISGTTPPQIVSISYGECESGNGAAANLSYKNTYQQAAAAGISVFVSSGDEGAASCDANRTVATHGIAVSGFTSTPYNVSVGGTDFGDTYASLQPSGLPLSTYWSASNTTGTDGSALSYIPEIPWNDSCASELIYTTAALAGSSYTQSYGSTGFCNSATGKADFRTTGSGSGGPSTYEVGNKPSWQSVLGNPSDNTRDIPDVSLFAANGVWNHFLLFCLSDASEGGTPCNYSSSNYTNVLDDLAAGGTSFASPIMAGIQALINQNAGGAQGNPNSRYYALGDIEYGAGGSTACNSSLGAGIGSGCVFNDVTLGDIDVNCRGTASSSENCYGYTGTNNAAVQGALSTSTSALSIAYGTNSGWDFATGLGTVNAWNMIQDWTSVVTTTAVSTSLTPSPFGQSVTFTATITPGIGNTETGTVTWSANTGCTASTVASGTATCTTTVLPVGSDTVAAAYSGDSNYGASSNSIAESIQPVATISVGTSPAGLAFTVDGMSYASAQSFTWVVGSTHSLSTTATQFGTGTQYTFAGWSDGTATVADSITVPSTATTYTASFSTSYLLAIAANHSAYGSITPASGSYYASGVNVSIAATPSAGDYFVNWAGSGDIASASSASTTITMNSPESITANFAPLPLLVVNTTGDADSGVAANCTPQATATSNTTDSACSLRDALTYAASSTAPSFNIGFDATVFATAQTITLSNGTLNVPSNTSVNGATSGTGSTLTNLVTVNGNLASEVFTVGSGVTGANLNGLIITNGSAALIGAGINNNGTVTVTNCTIIKNAAYNNLGGGIGNSGTLTLSKSTVSGNIAPNGEGGGIFNAATMTVTDSTISGNSAAGGSGGGIYNIGGTLTVTNTTISANSATSGGGIYVPSGTVNLANSIVSGNTADADIDGGFTNNGGNQVGVGSINLAPLGTYGGSTQTMPALPGSPAICAGTLTNWNAASLTADQRGFALLSTYCPTGSVDSGAVQTNYALAFSTEPPATSIPTLTLTPNPVAQLTESGVVASAASNAITVSGSPVALSGTTSTSLASGSASFSNIAVPTAATIETLTATLALTSSLNLTAQSSQIQVAFPAPPALTSPAPGSVLGTSNLTFSWTSGPSVYAYDLYLGTTGPGSLNLYNSGGVSTNSVTVPTLPSAGATVYARLFYQYQYLGPWQHIDYTYTESLFTPPVLSSPTPGSVLGTSNVVFSWTPGSGVTQYDLYLGTTGVGSDNLYNSAGVTTTSVTVASLPSLGAKVYARLFYKVNGVWQSIDYTYSESPIANPVLTSPTPSSVLGTTNVVFSWTPGSGVTQYDLYLGTTGAGSYNLYNSAGVTTSSVTVAKIPALGATVYARLSYMIKGVWQYTDYTYTETPIANPVLTSPAPGSVLGTTNVVFSWTPGSGVTQYDLYLGTTAGSANLYNSAGVTTTSVTVPTLPSKGVTVYARLYYQIKGVWQFTDYTYTEQ
jgi:hypothetical protein